MRVTDLADVLKAGGLRVVEEPNWKTTGNGELNGPRPKALVCHWTAGALTGDKPSLNTVRFGREGLRGLLSQLFLSRSGVWHVCGAGLAWHAGEVFDPIFNNYNSLGIEAEYHPDQGPWPEVQVESYVRGAVVLTKHYGWGVGNVRGHYEVCKPVGRKQDPRNILGGMVNFRARVQQLLSGESAPKKEDGDVSVNIMPFPGSSETTYTGFPIETRKKSMYVGDSVISISSAYHPMENVSVTFWPAGMGGRTYNSIPANKREFIPVPDGTEAVAMQWDCKGPVGVTVVTGPR